MNHHNHNYSGGIPLAVGDRYYAQDLGRDFWSLLTMAGKNVSDMYKEFPVLLKDADVEQGSDFTHIDMSAISGLVNYEVTLPDSFASLPPSTKLEDIIVRVDVVAQTDFDISGATLDGVTTNYLKAQYAETDGNSRNRVKKAGSYAYEKVPSYTLVCNSTAPTNYDLVLAEIVGDGSSFLTITNYFLTEKNEFVRNNSNLGWGVYALSELTTGISNLAIGRETLMLNTTGVRNIAIGQNALANNVSGIENIAIGISALFSNEVSENVAIGRAALFTNTTGIQNTAIGHRVLDSNSIGRDNTGVGHQALGSNTTGNYNTAIGSQSLSSNIPGNRNVAIGFQAMASSVSGTNNVAIGVDSLLSATDPSNNVAVGVEALEDCTTGSSNNAIGYGSLRNLTTGTRNVAVGHISADSIQTGIGNTCIGYNAGGNITTGQNNTCIGNDSEASSGSVSSQITLGNPGITSLRCAVTTITAISDMRDKVKVDPFNVGLDFIRDLNFREWNWNKREWYYQKDEKGRYIKDKNGNYIYEEDPKTLSKVGNRDFGLVVQEVQKVLKKHKVKWDGFILDDNPDKLELATGKILIPMGRAIQELADKVDALENKIEKQKA